VPNVYTPSLEALIPEAKAQGLDPEIVEFSDWKTPNLALQSGDIVKYFRHRLFLDNARIAEVSLREVDGGLIEAAQAMGCHRWHIVRRVLLPEALPGIVERPHDHRRERDRCLGDGRSRRLRRWAT
jgi:hypothetical protein